MGNKNAVVGDNRNICTVLLCFKHSFSLHKEKKTRSKLKVFQAKKDANVIFCYCQCKISDFAFYRYFIYENMKYHCLISDSLFNACCLLSYYVYYQIFYTCGLCPVLSPHSTKTHVKFCGFYYMVW
jgi:hypothetical protein